MATAPAPLEGAGGHASPAPDRILHNARVILVEPAGAVASAVAVRGDRIVWTGAETDVEGVRGPATKLIDLGGRTVIPGLTDAHGHVTSLGFAMIHVDATGTSSAEQVAAKVKEAASRAASGEWIIGRGWDQNDWSVKAFPTHALLDAAAPSNPVALTRIDGHALWVSRSALSAAGIGAGTKDPPGGAILRGAGGEPTGILVDNAMKRVEEVVPAPSRAQIKQSIVRALNRCLDSGLTEVHDAGISIEEREAYLELARERALPIRVYAMLGGTARALHDYFDDPPVIGEGDGFFTLRAIKLAVDGALGSRGAALLQDYTDDPGNKGLVTRPPEEIEAIARRAIPKGYQVCVHAIGDRGNRLVLDALGAALKSAPAGDYRFRIEHAQILDPADIPRFKALGIIPSMQPTHCTSDMPWVQDRLGPGRLAGAYAWRTLLRTGVVIPGGSDFPVESENPFLGLYAAITRQDAGGRPPEGWRPAERMTAAEALRSFTRDAAYAAFEESSRGAIGPGKLADLVILGIDPLTAKPAEILKAAPDAVIVGGRVVRSSDGLREALPVEAGAAREAGGR